MQEKVKRHIAQKELLQPSDKIIVAVSGGADSICLAHILLSLGYMCEIAHCNFHLRGEESDRDERFVTAFAAQHHVKLHKVDFQTTAYAEEHKLSIEMAARELRYQWFEKIRAENNAQCIAIAHHKDDSAETFLINLTRGTGLKGLCGIQTKNAHIVRPLLCLSREEIMEYLQKNNLNFVEDSTNKETVYTRNKFRNEIIPAFEKINPSFKDTLSQTIDYLNDANKIYESYIQKIAEKVVIRKEPFVEIDLNKISESIAPQSVMYEMLKEYGFNATQSQEIYDKRESSGKLFYAKEYVASTSRGIRTISTAAAKKSIEIPEDATEVHCGIRLQLERIINDDNFRLEKNNAVGYFDMDKLQFPLQLRTWEKGDYFYPFGMKCKKLLSDFFIDQKMSIAEKERAYILCSGKDIIWIAGMRTDDRYKITKNTKKILKITI